jgi:nicotinamide-nucleotide amidase
MNLSKKIGMFLKENNLVLSTAESCTAGLISSTLAQTPGSSAWLDSGFIVYTPSAKNKMLEVSFETIEKFNITSEEVAKEMATGAIKNSLANVSVAVTGVAGPGGGTKDIPVGTVCLAWCFVKNNNIIVLTEKVFFSGDRNEIREKVCEYALLGILKNYQN